MGSLSFPFDVFQTTEFPGSIGTLLPRVRPTVRTIPISAMVATATTPDSDPLVRLFTSSGSPALDSFLMRATELRVGHRVMPVQGWFGDVLPDLEPGRTFAFVHIDGDLFDSVYSALEHLWGRVEEGALVAIDDLFHTSQGRCEPTAMATRWSDCATTRFSSPRSATTRAPTTIDERGRAPSSS